MNNRVKIKEIFASIQGEGPYVGYKQLFIRFCGCNLKCNYCDTDFSAESDYKEFSALELAEEVSKYSDIHSISLTGGEPLLSTEFLKEFLPLVKKMPPHPYLTRGCNAHSSQTTTPSPTEKCCRRGKSYNINTEPLPLGEGVPANFYDCEGGEPPLSKGGGCEAYGGILHKIYLETNATLSDKFLEIKPYIDIVSADIKLESATGLNTFYLHDKFFEACQGVETFAKIVFNNKITDEEIIKCCELGQKYGIELILQPETLNSGKLKVESGKLNDFQLSTFNFPLDTILDKFLQNYSNVRLIPQVHKFLNVR